MVFFTCFNKMTVSHEINLRHQSQRYFTGRIKKGNAILTIVLRWIVSSYVFNVPERVTSCFKLAPGFAKSSVLLSSQPCFRWRLAHKQLVNRAVLVSEFIYCISHWDLLSMFCFQFLTVEKCTLDCQFLFYSCEVISSHNREKL